MKFSQTEKDKYCYDLTYIWNKKKIQNPKTKLIEKEIRAVVIRGGG